MTELNAKLPSMTKGTIDCYETPAISVKNGYKKSRNETQKQFTADSTTMMVLSQLEKQRFCQFGEKRYSGFDTGDKAIKTLKASNFGTNLANR